jgi:uncharacterized membrane protein
MKFYTTNLIVSLSMILALTPVQSRAQDQKNTRVVGLSNTLSSRPLWHDQKPVLTEFDVPGAATVTSPACGVFCGTNAWANNAAGAVAGSYTDKYVVAHGFLRTPGDKFVLFDAPGAGAERGLNEGSTAYGINEFGVITGYTEDAKGVNHGFVRYADGRFATFNAPGAGTVASQGTIAPGINNRGETAGYYTDGKNTTHGFVRSFDGHLSAFDPPGSVSTGFGPGRCLNDDGSAAGFFADANKGASHGFLRSRDGKITVIDLPGAGTSSGQGTQALSISDDGTITGGFIDANNFQHAYIRYPNRKAIAVNVTGQRTGGNSVNSFGSSAGDVYLDYNSPQHAYWRSPGGAVVVIYPPGAGTGAGQGSYSIAINRAGALVGQWVSPE